MCGVAGCFIPLFKYHLLHKLAFLPKAFKPCSVLQYYISWTFTILFLLLISFFRYCSRSVCILFPSSSCSSSSFPFFSLHLPPRLFTKPSSYRGDVMNRCAKYLSKPAVSSSGQPVRVTKLIRKNFVEKHQLQSDLLSKISLVEGERVYFDSDRRHHKSDGIIFQPDSPYTFSIDSDLLKWKWSEVRSVDLQVVLTPIPGVQSGTKGNINIFITPLYLCKYY